jgi:hypothetical protein
MRRALAAAITLASTTALVGGSTVAAQAGPAGTSPPAARQPAARPPAARPPAGRASGTAATERARVPADGHHSSGMRLGGSTGPAESSGSTLGAAPMLDRVNSSPHPSLTRTCPWCADATVVAFSEESLIRALARHLEKCPGTSAQEPT